MTELERAFIRKEYENHIVFTNRQLRDAFYNAYVNANRKKNTKFQELYKKKQAKVDKEYNINAVKVIETIEERDGKSWVDRIYRAAGMRKPPKAG